MTAADDRPHPGDVLLMLGTRKGTFLFWSDALRQDWRPLHSHGDWSVHAVSYDPRDGSIYAATNHNYLDQETLVQRSADGGVTWEPATQGPSFPDGRRAWQTWQVTPGHAQRPGEVWAGTREAGLFHSADNGKTWKSIASFNNHASQPTWEAGGGGLLLHTILVDPDDPHRLYAAVSMGGAFRSDDGGETWQHINHGLGVGIPSHNAATQWCVHKMALHPARPDVLFQQHHRGVYRSDDRGEHWYDISAGLSSRFGFPLALHPRDPDTVYVVPHVSENQRVVPEDRMAVWRSRNGGRSWQGLSAGLPEAAWFTVLREGLAADNGEPAGLYFGTSTGQVYLSRDEGDHWELMAEHLPGVISVNAATVVG